jgi:hypothetical protein
MSISTPIALRPAARRLLRQIADHDHGNGVHFDTVRGGRLRHPTTSTLFNRPTFTSLARQGFIEFGELPGLVRITGAGRSWLAPTQGTKSIPGQDAEQTRAGHRKLLTATQNAVRAVVADPTPHTLGKLDQSLCDIPLADLSDSAEKALHAALAGVSAAKCHDIFDVISALEETVEAMLARGPREPVHNHPATTAVLTALACCYDNGKNWQPDSARYQAWDRAAMTGYEALRAVTSFLYGETNHIAVNRRLGAFSGAARRAAAYPARDLVGTASVMAAESFGMFIIGLRCADRDKHGWLRRIGSNTYRFRVTPPDLYGGAPAGWLLVTRLSDGARVIHKLPLSTDEARSTAVSEALYLI